MESQSADLAGAVVGGGGARGKGGHAGHSDNVTVVSSEHVGQECLAGVEVSDEVDLECELDTLGIVCDKVLASVGDTGL